MPLGRRCVRLRHQQSNCRKRRKRTARSIPVADKPGLRSFDEPRALTGVGQRSASPLRVAVKVLLTWITEPWRLLDPFRRLLGRDSRRRAKRDKASVAGERACQRQGAARAASKQPSPADEKVAPGQDSGGELGRPAHRNGPSVPRRDSRARGRHLTRLMAEPGCRPRAMPTVWVGLWVPRAWAKE